MRHLSNWQRSWQRVDTSIKLSRVPHADSPPRGEQNRYVTLNCGPLKRASLRGPNGEVVNWRRKFRLRTHTSVCRYLFIYVDSWFRFMYGWRLTALFRLVNATSRNVNQSSWKFTQDKQLIRLVTTCRRIQGGQVLPIKETSKFMNHWNCAFLAVATLKTGCGSRLRSSYACIHTLTHGGDGRFLPFRVVKWCAWDVINSANGRK